MMEKVALKVKVRFVLASRELSEVLIDIVTLEAEIHKTSIFLDIDDSIQNEMQVFELFEFSRQKYMAILEYYNIYNLFNFGANIISNLT